MFIKKYEGTVNPFALPGLLNDYRMNLKNELTVANLQAIIEVVSEVTGIDVSLIIKKLRTREVTVARHIFFYLAKRQTMQTFSSIARFSGRDHTTVIHGVNTMCDLIETDEIIANTVKLIESKLMRTDRPEALAYTVIGATKKVYVSLEVCE